MTVSPVDDVLLLLSHRHRRQVVKTLIGRPEAPLEACIDGENPSANVRAAYERQLEELVGANVVAYDESTGTVSRGDEFERVRPVAEAVAEAESDTDRPEAELRRVQRTFTHTVRDTLQVLRVHASGLNEDGEHRDGLEKALERLTRRVELVDELADTIVEKRDARGEMAVEPVLREEAAALVERHRNVRFEFDTEADASVRADGRLPLVVENVLRNAVEHNDADEPAVRVSTTREEGRVWVTVEDNGPGFPSEDLDALLADGTTGGDKAVAGANAADEHEGATGANTAGDDGAAGGLGLYFVRESVESYGGELTVENRSPAGARVRIGLPAA